MPVIRGTKAESPLQVACSGEEPDRRSPLRPHARATRGGPGERGCLGPRALSRAVAFEKIRVLTLLS